MAKDLSRVSVLLVGGKLNLTHVVLLNSRFCPIVVAVVDLIFLENLLAHLQALEVRISKVVAPLSFVLRKLRIVTMAKQEKPILPEVLCTTLKFTLSNP